MRNILIPTALIFLFGTSIHAQESPPKPKIEVPDLNGRATLLIKPEATESADGSTLLLKVAVDIAGNAVYAQCSLNCHPSMKVVAEQAALASKFRPLVVKGEAVEYVGTLRYTIAIKRVDWYRFGQAMASVHNFDNLSVAPVAEALTNEYAVERARLIEIDNEKDVNVRIRKIAEEIEHFKKKLTGRDQWIFTTALTVRNATFWVGAAGPINREELQVALLQISKIAEGAPADISPSFIAGLREIAEYKIVPDITERQLRDDIMKLSMKLSDYPR